MDPGKAVVDWIAERPEARALTTQLHRPDSFAEYVTDPDASSLLADLRAFLEQRPTCSIYEVARRFGMSQRTLQRRLQELGTSFQREISAAQMRTAMRLMRETGNPLKWIAIESGFASLQHFSSSFRARVGESPSAWRAGRSVAKQAR